MTDYSNMSDFEINRLVARNLGFVQQGRGWITGADGIYDFIAKPNDDYRISLPDYCNSWADAGPIAEQNAICLNVKSPGEAYGWIANSWLDRRGDIRFRDKKPLRAICIVFLMMNEGE